MADMMMQPDDPLSRSSSACSLCQTYAVTDHPFCDLQNMMRDVQSGFVSAMTELAKIQGEDKQLRAQLENSESQHEAQMRDILDALNSLKREFESMRAQVEHTSRAQLTLEQQVVALTGRNKPQAPLVPKQRVSLLDELDTSYSKELNRDKYSSPMLRTFMASLPSGEDLPQPDEDVSDDSLEAVALRSIMLTHLLTKQAYSGRYSLAKQEYSSRQSDQLRDDRDQFSSLSGSESGSTLAAGCQGNPPHVLCHVQALHIATTIVDSERGYCTTLWDITENYQQTFLDCGILSSRDMRIIFPPCLVKIYEFHCGILKLMEGRLAKWGSQVIIGDIFARFTQTKKVDIFILYAEYINNFSHAVQAIHRLSAKPEFSEALDTCRRGGSAGCQALISLLTAPVRRMPTYVHQLKRLLKHTEGDHPDHFNLESSLQAFCFALQSGNDTMERLIQISDTSNSHPRSLESSSWSSHEEDQRLSTATKDSGIHSNGEDGLEEFSHRLTVYHPLKTAQTTTVPSRRAPTKQGVVSPVQEVDSGTLSLTGNLPLAAHEDPSVNRLTKIDSPSGKDNSIKSLNQLRSRLIRSNSQGELRENIERTVLPPRSKTPCSALIHNHRSPQEIQQSKQKLARSTPDLLNAHEISEMPAADSRKIKLKVKFSNPLSENMRSQKKIKRRSISDTLKLFFTKKRGLTGGSRGSSDHSDSTPEQSSLDDIERPSPPAMFANEPEEREEELTYEDENGDPYSVV